MTSRVVGFVKKVGGESHAHQTALTMVNKQLQPNRGVASHCPYTLTHAILKEPLDAADKQKVLKFTNRDESLNISARAIVHRAIESLDKRVVNAAKPHELGPARTKVLVQALTELLKLLDDKAGTPAALAASNTDKARLKTILEASVFLRRHMTHPDTVKRDFILDTAFVDQVTCDEVSIMTADKLDEIRGLEDELVVKAARVRAREEAADRKEKALYQLRALLAQKYELAQQQQQQQQDEDNEEKMKVNEGIVDEADVAVDEAVGHSVDRKEDKPAFSGSLAFVEYKKKDE